MSDLSLQPRAVLDGIAQPGRHGHAAGPPGLVIEERTGVQMLTVSARNGQADAVSAAVQDHWGLRLPTTPRWVGDDGLAFAWNGQAQWLAIAGPGTADLQPALRERLAGLASIVAHGAGRVVLRVSGPRVLEVLATGIAVDLHPRVFPTGGTAITLAGHIGIQLRKLDDAPAFEITAFRSFGADLYGWLLDAGLAHGVEIVAPASV